MNAWNHAIVTGGGSGLGLGFALRLLRRGCKVSVFAQKTGKLVAIAKQTGRRCCVLLGPTPIKLISTTKQFGRASRHISLALN